MDALTARPVDTLLCVGLFKLRRDYQHYLSGMGVFETEAAYFGEEGVSVDAQLARMWELHRIFEMWAFLKHNLPSLPAETMRAVLSHTAQQAAAGGLDKDHPLEALARLPRFTGTTTAAVNAMTRKYVRYSGVDIVLMIVMT